MPAAPQLQAPPANEDNDHALHFTNIPDLPCEHLASHALEKHDVLNATLAMLAEAAARCSVANRIQAKLTSQKSKHVGTWFLAPDDSWLQPQVCVSLP